MTDKYSGFGIPKVEYVGINSNNVKSLEGYYFMVVGSAANGYSAINYGRGTGTDVLRLTANTPNIKSNEGGQPVNYRHLYSVPATVSNPDIPDGLLSINGAYPKNLDYAVELVNNRASVKYFTGA